MVQWKKSEWNLQHIVHASHWAEPKCVCHRVYSQKRVHCTKEKDICWGIETDTNYHQLSPIITYYHQFVHQCHQYYGLILIGLTRQFQKYVYVGVSKQIPIFTNYHQLSPICSPISPILWFNIDRLNEMIPKICICWGIEADTNFHQLSPIITNYHHFFTNFNGLILMGSTRRFQKYIYVWVLKVIPISLIFTNFHQFSPIFGPIF